MVDANVILPCWHSSGAALALSLASRGVSAHALFFEVNPGACAMPTSPSFQGCGADLGGMKRSGYPPVDESV